MALAGWDLSAPRPTVFPTRVSLWRSCCCGDRAPNTLAPPRARVQEHGVCVRTAAILAYSFPSGYGSGLVPFPLECPRGRTRAYLAGRTSSEARLGLGGGTSGPGSEQSGPDQRTGTIVRRRNPARKDRPAALVTGPPDSQGAGARAAALPHRASGEASWRAIRGLLDDPGLPPLRRNFDLARPDGYVQPPTVANESRACPLAILPWQRSATPH